MRRQMVSQLRDFYDSHGIGPEKFSCRHAEACVAACAPRQLLNGMEAHLGVSYGDLTKVVIVSLDAGKSAGTVEQRTLGGRTEGIEAVTLDGPNSHMWGTLTFMHSFFGRDVGDASPMAYCAMLNSAKCSDKSSMNTVPWAVHKNCLEHLLVELQILRPEVIWIQGRTVRDLLWPYLTSMPSLTSNEIWLQTLGLSSEKPVRWVQGIVSEYLKSVRIGELQSIAVETPHPSDRYGRWGLFERAMMPMVADVVSSIVKAKAIQ